MPTISKRPFGRTADGILTTLCTITDDLGFGFSVTDYGATLVSLFVPDRQNNSTDVLLGFDDVSGYEEHDGYAGTICGRVANRIRNASFELNGETVMLNPNEGEHQLHGGPNGFDKKIWQIEEQEDGVLATLESPDLDQGYPGALQVQVRYRLLPDCILEIDYLAHALDDTVCSLTNHAYFNLNGLSGDALNQTLRLTARAYTPLAPDGLTDGTVRPVHGVFDLTTETPIRTLLASEDPSVLACRGIDHNFALPNAGEQERSMVEAAQLYGQTTGIELTISTTMPGLQVYTGNYINGWPGKNGIVYGRHAGVALETQFYPNAVNIRDFPSPYLRAGDTQHNVTRYQFCIRE